MIARRLVLALLVTGATALAPAAAQVFTPQSSTGLTVTFQTERMGGSRVLIFGDVRNATGQTYERVVLLAEGLDGAGQVVSRGRTYVSGTVNPNSSSAFGWTSIGCPSRARRNAVRSSSNGPNEYRSTRTAIGPSNGSATT